MKNIISLITINFLTITVLLALFVLPMYFARNFTQVAGVKTESPYLMVSQISKFPNLTYEQVGDNYKVSVTKQAQSQAFLSVFIINNPTKTSKTYSIETEAGESEVFFGEDLQNKLATITVPTESSITLSILTSSIADHDTIEFKITSR